MRVAACRMFWSTVTWWHLRGSNTTTMLHLLFALDSLLHKLGTQLHVLTGAEQLAAAGLESLKDQFEKPRDALLDIFASLPVYTPAAETQSAVVGLAHELCLFGCCCQHPPHA